jgi:arylsulfatase A-like enzyme
VENARGSVSERVGLVDLTPTLLELLEQAAPENLDGRSFAGALHGEKLEEQTYYAEVDTSIWYGRPTKKQPRDVAVYHGPLKVERDDDHVSAFDLRLDPLGLAPLEVLEEDERFIQLEKLTNEFFTKRQFESGQVTDPVMAEELRALGYIE